MKKNLSVKHLMMAALMLPVFTTGLRAQSFKTEEAPMMRGVTRHIKNGWAVDPLITVGETNNASQDVNFTKFGYKLPGILDGIGAWKRGSQVKLVVNSELPDNRGYSYTLANGTVLTGARMSYLNISASSRETKEMGLAYNKVYDRAGAIVTNANQINEGLNNNNGFNRFCSGHGVSQGQLGFTKDIYFAGEETAGGQLTALDVNSKELHVVPMAGRAAFENVAPIENYNTNKVAFLIGDDRGPAPLILYVGEKWSNASGYVPANSFLKTQGLAKGALFVWVADGDRDLTSFNVTGSTRTGKFVKINHFNYALRNTPGYDALGFASQEKQEELANAVNYFRFSRPEDLAVNPDDKTQVAMASTGLSTWLGGVDSWGDLYIVDFNNADLKMQLRKPLNDINNIKANIKLLYNGDDSGGGQFAGPDFGLRSPDNLDWSKDGHIYVNEDRSITGFGLTSNVEASLWQADPESGELKRILEIDRNAVPFKQTDAAITDVGNWESSGVLDVSDYFDSKPGETILILDVQAHSLNSDVIGGPANLVEGGQLLLASKRTGRSNHHPHDDDDDRFAAPVAAAASDAKPAAAELSAPATSSLLAYPTPAHQTLYLTKNADVSIYDMNGRLLITQKNSRQINVSALKPGSYLLKTPKEEQTIIIQ